MNDPYEIRLESWIDNVEHHIRATLSNDSKLKLKEDCLDVELPAAQGEDLEPVDDSVDGGIPVYEEAEPDLRHEPIGDLDGANSKSVPTSPSPSTIPSRLISRENDLLLPPAAEIRRTYAQGRATWLAFVKAAVALPLHSWPVGIEDPSAMLKDVPALLESLPKSGVLTGHPLWQIPNPKQVEKELVDKELIDEEQVETQDEGWNPGYAWGARKSLLCDGRTPVQFSLSPSSHGDLVDPDCLSILTICWSYILSVKFLELQGRKPKYPQDRPRPTPYRAHTVSPRPQDVVINLGSSASPALVQWLCLLLTPMQDQPA